jgi:stage V sporulation protein B
MGLKKQSFLYGTMILLAAGIINRVLGFVPRIALPRIIGAEGVGLYQLSYPFMIVMLTIITGGIPLTVAKMVAEAEAGKDQPRIKRILRTALLWTSGLSALFMVISWFSAPWITSRWLTDARVYYTFVSMIPILGIVGISSVFRGYFQGKQNMIPTAVSQIGETAARIVAMLLFSYFLLPYGLAIAAAGAMGGVVAGECVGLLILLFQFRRARRESSAVDETPRGPGKRKQPPVWRELIRLSVPVTGGKLVGSVSYLLESILTARSLAAAGIATAVATAQYGALQGMVVPLLLLPTALTGSLAVSLVPSLSEAAARGRLKEIHKRLHQSLRLTLVAGGPFAVVMFVLAEPLCLLLYNDPGVAPMLQGMAPVALFIYMQGPLHAALQALNKPGAALTHSFIGACVKLILIMQLASRPEFGIFGAVAAICASALLVATLDLAMLIRSFRFPFRFEDVAKVGAGMLFMGSSVHLIRSAAASWIHWDWLAMLLAAAAGAGVYLFLMVRFQLIDRFDLIRIPILNRIIR